MSDQFDRLIPEARAFLSELAANNSRDWFTANKARYTGELKIPATHLMDQIAQDWGNILGHPLKSKLFRPQRDIRFSKDKTPYTTHLHMLWSEPDGPGWFLGISPDYVTAGGGLMGFDKAQLITWRAAIDSPQGTELAKTMAAIPARIDEPELKRVPAPYDKTHPNAALLRRKSMTMWIDIADDCAANGLVPALKGAFQMIRPAIDQVRVMT